jgi:hypothetical protein
MMAIPSSAFVTEVTRQNELATPIIQVIFGNRTLEPVKNMSGLRLPYAITKNFHHDIIFPTENYE